MENILTFMNMIGSNKIATFFVVLFFGTIWIFTQIPKIKQNAKAPIIPETQDDWKKACQKSHFLLWVCPLGGIFLLIIYLNLKPFEMNTDVSLFGFKVDEVLFYLKAGMVITFFGFVMSIYDVKTIKQKYLTQPK